MIGSLHEQPECLRHVLQNIRDTISQYSVPPPLKVKSAEVFLQASKLSGMIPHIHSSQQDLFLHLWRMGESVLVNLKHEIDSVWSPDILCQLYGTQEIDII